MRKEFIFISDGYRGGANTFLYDHMQYLIKKNKKVILIDKNPNKTFEKLNKKILIYKINLRNNISDTVKFLQKIIISKKNKKNYIMITNYAFLILFFFYFRNLNKKQNKLILTLHSGIFEMNLKKYLAGLLFSMMYKEVDYLFFGSNSSKLWWKNKFPWMNIKKSLVHFNGIKIKKKISPRIIKKKVQISFAGRLEKENNPEFFINIANKLLEKNENVIINIFGDGTLLSKLKKKNISPHIKFHGWVPKERIYKLSNIIVITSELNNFPYVALEAKSYGIPVVSCSKGDISKIIKNNIDGFIKYTNSDSAMVLLIQRIINNYSSFSKNSLKRAKYFELDRSCKKFWKSVNV